MFDSGLWYTDGVTAPVLLNAANRSTYVRTRVEVSTFAAFVSAIRANNNAYIALTNDITYDRSLISGENAFYVEQFSVSIDALVWNFSGVIDGQGHSFTNVTRNADDGGVMYLIKNYTGILKNIAIEGTLVNPTTKQYEPASILAFNFSGAAMNVKLTVKVGRLKWNGNDTQQSGALFGVLKNGAYIKNVLIDYTPSSGSENVIGFGFIAGYVESGASVTIRNIAVINRGDPVRPLVAMVQNGAMINGNAHASSGRYHTSDPYSSDNNAIAGAFNAEVVNLLMGNESTVCAGAGEILGSAWNCDGVNLPSLKASS